MDSKPEYRMKLVRDANPLIRVKVDGEQHGEIYTEEHTAYAAALEAKANNPDAEVFWERIDRVYPKFNAKNKPADKPTTPPAPEPQPQPEPDPEPEPEPDPQPEPAPQPDPDPPAEDNPSYMTATVTFSEGDAPVKVEAPRGKLVRVQYPDGSNSPLAIRFFNQNSFALYNGYLGLTSDLNIKALDAVAGGMSIALRDFKVYAYRRSRAIWFETPETLSKIDYSRLPPVTGGAKGVTNISRLDASDPSDVTVIHKWMPDYGERDDIGLIPAWDARGVANRTDANDRVIRVMGDCAGPVVPIFIDPDTDELLDPSSYDDVKRLTTNWWWLDNVDGIPISRASSDNPYTPDAAHATGFGITAYEFYGADFDAETMVAWAIWCAFIWQNPSYRQNDGAGVLNIDTESGSGLIQDRTIAWVVKTLAAAGDCDHWLSPLCRKWAVDFADQVKERMERWPNIYPQFGGMGSAKGSFKPWQTHDYMAMSFGFAIQRGLSEFEPCLQWLGRGPVEAVLSDPHELATAYEVRARPNEDSPIEDSYETWDEILAATAETSDKIGKAVAGGENTQALQDAYPNSGGNPGNFVGYPFAPDGYPAARKAALAYCVIYGVPDADKAWKVMLEHDAADFSTNPKYNIDPTKS